MKVKCFFSGSIIQSILLPLFVLIFTLAAGPLQAQISMTGVQVVDVTPNSFSVLWHADVASEPRIEVFTDVDAINNVTNDFEVVLFPLQGLDPDVTGRYERQQARQVFIDGIKQQGLMKVQVLGLSPNEVYYFRIYSNSESDSGVWPLDTLETVITQNQNSFVGDARQLFVNLEDPDSNGWQVIVSAPSSLYPVSAVVGDGIAGGMAVVNLANLFRDGVNLVSTEIEQLTVEVLDGDGQINALDYDLGFNPGFQVSSDFSFDFDLLPFDGVIRMLSPAVDIYSMGNERLLLRWVDQLSEEDGLVSLYYDSDNQGFSGELIVAGLSEDLDGDGDAWRWNLASLSDGQYYVYAVLSDGRDSVSQYAQGRITVDGNGFDADGDNMSDLWEQHHFGTTEYGADDDFDNDGISNLYEFINNTDPSIEDAIGEPTAPAIDAPIFAGRVESLRPELGIRNSSIIPMLPLSYDFEIYADAALTQLVTANTGVTQQEGDTTHTQVEIDLSENTRYYWRARAFGGAMYSQWSNGEFFVDAVPEAPGAFSISSPSNGAEVDDFNPLLSISNSVDPDQEVLTYVFEVFSDEALTQLVTASDAVVEQDGGSTQWLVDVLLEENGQYYWHVIANDSDGFTTTTTSAALFVNTANEAPLGLALLAPIDAAEVVNTNVDLIATEATDPDSDPVLYRFEIDTVNTFDSVNLQRSGSVADSAYAVTDLQEDTTYYWRVLASDGFAESAWLSASFRVNASNQAPSVPSIANPGNDAWVATVLPTLSVNPAVDGDGDVLTYQFEIYSDDSLTNLIDSESSSSESWMLSIPLEDNRWYVWRVQAQDDNGATSDWSVISRFFVNDNNVDDAPRLSFLTRVDNVIVTEGQLLMQWFDDDPDSAATIDLYYDNDDSGSDGVLIIAGLEEDLDGEGDRYIWDTSQLSNGDYYVYALIQDDTTETTAYLPARIQVENGDNEVPSYEWLAPLADIGLNSGEIITLSWVDDDADSRALISLYYDEDTSGADGQLIVENIAEDIEFGGDNFVWRTTSVPLGRYYVYAQINDGINVPVTVYSPAVVTIVPAEILGSDADDVIDGSQSSDRILGGEGADILNGLRGDDQLDGGAGDDTLNGGVGDDTYLIGLNAGHDTINNFDHRADPNTRQDRLVFGEGIFAEDVSVTLDGRDVLLTLNDGAQSVRLENFFELWQGQPLSEVSEIIFADGTQWDPELLRELSLSGGGGDDVLTGLPGQNDRIEGGFGDDQIDGGDGDDLLFGGEGNDHLLGGTGNDELHGGSGNDRLEGGRGDDLLIGGEGDDYLQGWQGDNVYQVNIGGGHDVINNYNFSAPLPPTGLILFGEGVLPENVVASVDGSDLLLTVIDVQQTVRVERHFAFWQGVYRQEIASVEFSDGTVWHREDIRAQVLITSEQDDVVRGFDDRNDVIDGGEGSDVIDGGEGDDRLSGGGGQDELKGGDGDDWLQGGLDNDLLVGGEGGDTYVFALGDGSDIIDNFDFSVLNEDRNDRIRFDDSIAVTDIILSRQGDDLLVTINGYDQTIEVPQHFFMWGEEHWSQLAFIEFSDGTTWNAEQIHDRLSLP